MNQKGKACLTIAVLLLHQLIVAGTAAKLTRKNFFEELEEITIKVIHPLSGEFLVAPDVVEMKCKAGSLQCAATIAQQGLRIVAIVDIQQ